MGDQGAVGCSLSPCFSVDETPLLFSLVGPPSCIHGEGKQSRNFMYIEDVASAFVAVLSRGQTGATYNIGDTVEMSIRQVVESIVKVFLGRDLSPEEMEDFIEHVPDRAYNDHSYHIDSSRLRALGWEPTVAWEDGLKRTLDWYAENEDFWEEDVVHASLLPHPHFTGFARK